MSHAAAMGSGYFGPALYYFRWRPLEALIRSIALLVLKLKAEPSHLVSIIQYAISLINPSHDKFLCLTVIYSKLNFLLEREIGLMAVTMKHRLQSVNRASANYFTFKTLQVKGNLINMKSDSMYKCIV
jgi:hypothetical protein